MAPVVHAAEQATLSLNSPSATGLPSSFAFKITACVLCIHIEHFSITPLDLTVTSGLITILPRSLFM